MKKIFLILFACLLFASNTVFAIDTEKAIVNDMMLQNHINEIGTRILNANKIDLRMVFLYSRKDKLIKGEPSLTKRQIIIYDKNINNASNDDEIAAFLAREICKTAESYMGQLKGLVGSAQVKFAPKKYEIFFDKRAVDFMVTAGYNPLALITYINKNCPQKRFDTFARSNLTSKRLANIYEYIYTKYPYFLANNTYISNPYYQNFLLTSINNRQKLQQKIEKNTKKEIKYE